MIERFKSRKFILVAIALVVFIGNDYYNLGLSRDTLNQILALVLGYGAVNSAQKIISEIRK